MTMCMHVLAHFTLIVINTDTTQTRRRKGKKTQCTTADPVAQDGGSSVGVDTGIPSSHDAVMACYDVVLLFFLAGKHGRHRGKTTQCTTADPVTQDGGSSDGVDTGMSSSCSDCLL